MFDAGAIVGRMILDRSKWEASVEATQKDVTRLSYRMEELGNGMMKTGKELGKLGSRLASTGTVILAPFAIAMALATKNSGVMEEKTRQLTHAFNSLVGQLAAFVVPWIDRLTAALKAVSAWFNKLPTWVKQLTADVVIGTGAMVLMTGIVVSLAGKLIFLTGVLLKVKAAILVFSLAHPILATVAAVGLLIAAVIKFRDVIGNVIKSAGIILEVSLLSVVINIRRALEDLLIQMTNMPLLLKGVKVALGNVAAGLSDGTDKLQMKVDEALAKLAELWGGTPKPDPAAAQQWNEFFSGISKGAEGIVQKFGSVSSIAANAMDQTADAMFTAMEDGFFKLMTGQFASLQETAVNFGNALLHMFAQVIARLIMYKMIAIPLASAFGIPMAGISFKDGTESVPETGMYRLHEGERVVPKYDATKSDDSEPIQIYNLVTSEAVARAMAGKDGRKVIMNVIGEDNSRNGVMRREIKRGR